MSEQCQATYEFEVRGRVKKIPCSLNRHLAVQGEEGAEPHRGSLGRFSKVWWDEEGGEEW